MKTFNIRYRSIEKLKDFLALHAVENEKNILVQIFTSLQSPSKITSLAASIKELLPQAHIVGCTSDGEIIEGKILTQNTIISLCIFQETHIQTCMILDTQEQQASQIAAHFKQESKALILLATFQSRNAQDLLNELYHDKRKPKDLVIAGGVAADAGEFKNSFVFNDTQISNAGVIAVILSGEKLQASNAYSHDWEPISRRFQVNKVEDNRVYTLDNKSIKTLYAHYIGQDMQNTLALYALQFPFVVTRDNKHISKLALEDASDGSILFSSNIKEGEILQIAYANIEKVSQSIQTLFEELVSKPSQTLFVYTSSARRRFIEAFHIKEIDALSRITKLSGFCGYGEFYANSTQCNLLSQSIAVLSLSENTEKVVLNYESKKKSTANDLDYQTVKVLSNIAQVSSKELQEVNQILEERVQKGIRENRKKDSIMIHNSKLAQLGEMLGLIAHQWRQPLSAISATASGMQIKFELDSWTPEYVESSLTHIEEYVLHLSDTINDFTNFFKPSKRQQSTTSRELITKALFIMSPLLSKDNVLVVKRFSSENNFSTYPNEVVQVLLNLIKNADNALLKNQVTSPEIYINEYHDKTYNIIEISDNAGGIDTQIMDKIFEPYFSTKNAEDSMGLGLYMSKFIIEESCGGRLSVENIEGGVKFTIRLEN